MGPIVASVLLAVAPALGVGDASVALKVRASPEVHRDNDDSPFSAASELTGLDTEQGRGEVDARVRFDGLTADLSARTTLHDGETASGAAMLNELFFEDAILGGHITVGKKVISWDVGFGFRPLDVVQREDRRAFNAFTLEGVPLIALEHFGDDWAWTVVYTSPLRGRESSPRDDEAVAGRGFFRVGGVDLHAVARWSTRTQLQAGGGVAAVLSDALEVHGSALYQRRTGRDLNALVGAGGPPVAASDPVRVVYVRDEVAALAGFTLSPGWDLSVTVEGWHDPSATTADQWRDRAALARRQNDLLGSSEVPREIVLANLAWGTRLFGRPNLLRDNAMLHASQKWDRFEPAVDVLYTPADGGWVATASVAYEGESTRLDVAARAFGGPTDAAYRLLPQTAMLYASWQLSF